MLRRSFALASCLLLVIAPIGAQSGASPLSGTWVGALTPQSAPNSRSVTLELVADRDGRVSGTMAGMPRPADVKAGTFNAKTGALKLEVGIKGEDAVLMVFEGTVVKDTATGTITTGDGGGDFKLAKKK
jgi:hypothetical protein